MNEKSSYQIHIRKEALKFSSAHMTVFSDGTKEALHGHNYRSSISVDFERFSLSEMIPFSDFKSAMKAICDQWDEKVLLPAQCPYFKITHEDESTLDFTLCGKRYLLPRDEVELLPLDNVTTETLAAEFCKRLVTKLGPETLKKGIRKIEVKIEEMLGQGASFFYAP